MTLVLAIDDSADMLDLLEARLRPEGLVLERALSATDGLEKASTVEPQLILLDLDMPDMSGLVICQRLKSDPRTRDIPVIFISAESDVRVKVQGFDLGAVDYVTKPFQTEELRARVRAALRTKRYQDLLANRAQTDALTGLRNRQYFDQRLNEELHAAARYGRKVSVVLLDLDHFKSINDRFGHPFGDRVLQSVGETLARAIRAADAACRYGGEELALVLTETPRDGAAVLAERIRERIAALEFRPRGKQVTVTASFGVATTDLAPNQSDVRPASLVATADHALYAAKHAGRNRVVVAEAWHASA